MKKGISLLLVFCVLLALCSCEKQVQQAETLDHLTVSFAEQCQEETLDGGNQVSVQWQQLNLSEEDAKNYPKLKKSLDTYNENISLYADESMVGLRESALSMIPYREHPITLYLNTGVYLQRADSRILSFLEQNDIYSGGMHPNHYYDTYNFDSVSGEEIILSDVITDMDAFAELVAEKLNEKYPDGMFWEELSENLAEYQPTDYCWTMDYQGITVWFSPYEVASYAQGPLNVKLYFDEEPELFLETYDSDSAKHYAIAIPTWQVMDFDLVADDGKTDMLKVEGVYTDSELYSGITASVNGETYTEEVSVETFYVYFVQMEGKSYLYYDCITDTDSRVFVSVDLNHETPQQAAKFYDTEMEYNKKDEVTYRECFNNPKDLPWTTEF